MKRTNLTGNIGSKQTNTMFTYITDDTLASTQSANYFEDMLQNGDMLYVYSNNDNKGVIGLIQDDTFSIKYTGA